MVPASISFVPSATGDSLYVDPRGISALHRWWGFGLIAFHIGTGVFMSIVTTENSLLLGVFLAASPFAAAGEWSVRASLCSLPLFGALFRRFFLSPAASEYNTARLGP